MEAVFSLELKMRSIFTKNKQLNGVKIAMLYSLMASSEVKDPKSIDAAKAAKTTPYTYESA
jgi:hypothetical protein